MTNPFPDIILSCNIPSKITIDQCDDDVFNADIYINGKHIYGTTLQRVRGVAYFYDVNSIVTEYMQKNGLVMASMEIEARYEGGADSCTTTIIYADVSTQFEDDDEFLKYNYLTTRSFFMIPRTNTESVRFFATPSESAHLGSVSVVCRFPDGSIQTVSMQHNLSSNAKNAVYSFSVDPRSINYELKKLYPTNPPTALSATYHHGKRVITLFITDVEPDLVFIFYNAFNCAEKAYIYGSSTCDTTVTQKEAVAQRTTSFYSRDFEQRFKVETASLSLEEATWLNQLFVSWRVLYETPSSGVQMYALIDDVNSEIPYNSADPIRLKFSYRFTQNTPFHLSQSEGQVYGTAYSQEFD